MEQRRLGSYGLPKYCRGDSSCGAVGTTAASAYHCAGWDALMDAPYLAVVSASELQPGETSVTPRQVE